MYYVSTIKTKNREVEFIAKKESELKKLDELKRSPVGKVTGAVTTKKSIGAIGGSAVGAVLGGSLGVAGKLVYKGFALNGGIVLAGIGAVFGFLGVKAFTKNKSAKKHEKDNC